MIIVNNLYRSIFLILTLSLCCSGAVYSQTTTEPTLIKLNKKEAFDRTVDYILNQSYLLNFSDFGGGQIQYIVTKNSGNKLFSSKKGERYTVNIIIRELDDNKTALYQQVNIENILYKDYVLYLEDRGISSEPKIYQPLLDSLIRYLEQANE